MVKSSLYLPVLMPIILLLSERTMGLTSTSSSTKFGMTSRRLPISQHRDNSPRALSHTFTGDSRYNFLQSNTRLTSSTYIDSRHVSNPLLSLRMIKKRTHRWTRNLLQRKSKRSLIIGTSSVILAAIVMFGPAFSPAAYAADVTTTAATASAAAGLSPVAVPFSSQSRSLGSFNILPTKAELELCFRLLYSACSGAFVGLERSSSDRPAGVRTMALVGLGACIYTVCSIHGFLPHIALGLAPGSPILSDVKVDLSRMAANIASGVGFIGAGAIHKSKMHGTGTENQNVVAGLTTAAAIWVSAAVGIASAVGLYFVGAVATFSTVMILKYARLPMKDEEEPGFSWKPRELEVVDDDRVVGESQTSLRRPQEHSTSPTKQHDALSGLFGSPSVTTVSGYDPFNNAFVDQHLLEDSVHPIIEDYLRNRLRGKHQDIEAHRKPKKPKVSIEEEQEVVAYNATDEQETSVEP